MKRNLYIPIDIGLSCTVECTDLVKRGDTLDFTFKMFNKGTLKDLTGQTVTLNIEKPDGKIVEAKANINTSTITASVGVQGAVLAGTIEGDLKIKDTDGSTSSNTFTFTVQDSVSSDILEKSQDVIASLDEVRELVLKWNEQVELIGVDADAVEALNGIKNYIENTLPTLQDETAWAKANLSNLDNKNSTASTNITNLINQIATADDLLDKFRLYDTTNLIQQVQNNTASLSNKANLASINFKACYLAKTLEKLYKEVDDVLFMFIGDSVTCGSNATDQTLKGYVGLFASWIATQFPDSTVILARGSNITSLQPLTGFTEVTIQTGTKNTIRIVNAGIWGDSMFQLFNRSNNFIKYNNIIPDCVFLMDGINDSDPGNTNRYSSVSEFKQLQSAFVDYLRDITDAEIVIQTSHWTGDNPNSRINPYVVAQRELANEKNLLLIDHKFVWDNHYSFGLTNHGQGDWMTKDDPIHPTDIGHESISDNIKENMFKTKRNDGLLRNMKPLSDMEGITYKGTWEDKIISDSATATTYTYKRTNTVGSYFTAPLAGNEIYAIVRDGRDEVVFNNNSPQYDSNEQIKIGGMVYPSVLVTVNNEDMYAKHHKRVLLYRGKYKYCEVTLQHVNGNLDIYGFETVTYKGEGTEDDTSISLALYCDSINGSDSNDGLSSTSAFKTISKAIDYSRDYLDKTITINVMENTTENVDLTSIYPHSIDSYVIKGYNNVVKQIGYFHAKQVGKFRLDYIKTVTNSDYSILLNDVLFTRFNYVDISDSTNSTKIGLYLSNGAKCFSTTLNGDNKNELVHCENGSQLVIGLTNNPTNCTTLANATTGGIINFTNANIPQYTSKLAKSAGGVMFNIDGTVI